MIRAGETNRKKPIELNTFSAFWLNDTSIHAAKDTNELRLTNDASGVDSI